MDSAGEDEADLIGGNAAVDRLGDGGNGLLPEDEAGPWPDVAAALAAFEDEPACSVLEVLLEQPGRGDVQVSGDAVSLEHFGLVGAAAGDQGERGLDLTDGGKLLGPQLRRERTRGCRRPRVGSPSRVPLRATGFGPRAREAMPGPERERTLVRDGAGERGDVADASHWALENRKAGAVIEGQRGALGERPGGPRGGEPLGDGALDGLDDAAGRDELSRQPCGECGVLTGRWALTESPADFALDGLVPGRPVRNRGGLQACERFGGGRGVDTETGAGAWNDDRGFTAVPAAQAFTPIRGERGLAGQEQRAIEDDAGGTGGHAAGRDVRADSAAHPDGQIAFGQHSLQEHERGLGAAQTAGFVAGENQPVEAGGPGECCLGPSGHLGDRELTGGMDAPGDLRQTAGLGGAERDTDDGWRAVEGLWR